MLKALFLVLGLLVSAPAHAQEEPKVRGPVETVGDALAEQKSEKELKQEERLKALEAANGQKAARVVVLKWPGTDTDHTTESLQRNIRVRIARPNAKFYPELDLYQAGRKEPDRTINAVNQRAVVPDAAIDLLLRAVEDTATIPWNALSEQDWGLKAHEMRELANQAWFIDRKELREPMFLLYSQIGRAAENRNDPAPPFYEQIGGRAVNYYWYLAGAMANEEPALMSKLTEQDMHASIGYYKDLLDRGDIPAMTLSFELSGEWNSKAFASEYQLFINGLEVLVTDDKGLHRVPPGRVDVYMSRDDGHSLSDRIEIDKLDEKIYGVLDVARKKMGLQFKDQLMEHPNECTPEVDGDILRYLAIYAKLHGDAEIYIAVPEAGSTASNKIHLWRWDRQKGLLMKVAGDNEFPVRFAILLGAGLDFSNAGYEIATADEIADAGAAQQPNNPTGGIDAAERLANEAPKLAPSGVPIHFHLRGHYGRLLIATGLEYTVGTDKGPWQDLYQTDSKLDNHELTVPVPTTAAVPPDSSVDCTKTPDQCTEIDVVVDMPVLHEEDWSRLVFLGAGVVLGKKAAIGFGPRLLLRTGWYNVPRAADITAHAGYSAQAPFSKKANGRVRPLVDLNLYGGVMVPIRDSLATVGKFNARGNPLKMGSPFVRFGFQLSVGITF